MYGFRNKTEIGKFVKGKGSLIINETNKTIVGFVKKEKWKWRASGESIIIWILLNIFSVDN